MATVDDKGDVTVEDQFVGRLEGFRFIQDPKATPDEAKTLRSASLVALKPEFHLRADRFYNSPDTEIDYTEQGGLMWGEHAVGKLVAGSDALKPTVVAFVDDDAGVDVIQKVQRRLQHFFDRKVATLFEPMLALSRDEELTGLARGFAFRLVEALGVLRRDAVMTEVKELDQDARAALRKHGIRFGQFTIFMPLLLKPAATRLRLLLWSLTSGHAEFPEAPPPGLVTVPSQKEAPKGYHTMAGYRQAGERAIRIDMLERLADLLRVKDSRGGFEANPDMLSITGMTLEQFADLMQGLGYKAVKDEREKVKATPVVVDASEADAPESAEATAESKEDSTEAEVQSKEESPEVEVQPTESSAEVEAQPAEESTEAQAEVPVDSARAEKEAQSAEKSEEAPEMEAYYTFTWAGNRPARREGAGKPRNQGKPRGKPKGKPKGKRQSDNKPKSFSARPAKKDTIDPDNPFAAALMGLQDKS